MNKLNDINFLRENMMGPNAIKILEEMCNEFTLTPGSRVLDLGCGKGLTSIYLAQNYGVHVYATDLWIPATENYHRFQSLGLADKIIPIHAEAHQLPYADGFFDAMICIDSYNYYGAEDGFMDKYISPLIKKNGIIAIAVSGLKNDFEEGIPQELIPFWQEPMEHYSLKWWKELLCKSQTISLTHCYSLNCHHQAWQDWLQCDNPYAKRDIEMMKADQGKYFDLIGMIAKVK